LSEIVNLRRFRKQKARAEADRHAGANRALFGQSKDERTKSGQEQDKATRMLDQHLIEGKDRE
jgi:hypothetical protein